MNSHCIQIIQMVIKNTLQIYTNISLPNKYILLKSMDYIQHKEYNDLL